MILTPALHSHAARYRPIEWVADAATAGEYYLRLNVTPQRITLVTEGGSK